MVRAGGADRRLAPIAEAGQDKVGRALQLNDQPRAHVEAASKGRALLQHSATSRTPPAQPRAAEQAGYSQGQEHEAGRLGHGRG